MVIVDGVSGKSTFFVTKYHPFIPKFTMSEKTQIFMQEEVNKYNLETLKQYSISKIL